ncbi:hypothetical protein CKO28_16045 [Rhodovibrio sodomensis]|uniref:Uncharacterized protein n=1 Tax=Rhodovibrio sodomensis TaxID=1088 RepID=A0ABS1DHS8_9PROT|nr:hypothetical protein [Rhodovibrio sodomensis]MBK1669551.1 hypothetical protein [Rhodovibrio sodomensis]
MSGNAVSYAGALDPARAIDDLVAYQADSGRGGGFASGTADARLSVGENLAETPAPNALVFSVRRSGALPGAFLSHTDCG